MDTVADAVGGLPDLGGHTSLRGQVAEALRHALASGTLRSGVVYSAPTLAEEFGISATPVREAMIDLVRDGLFEAVRNRGFRVVPLSDRARAELSEGLAAARRALADMRDVVAGRGEIELAAEAESTRAALAAAGIEVSGTVQPVPLPAETDTLLATVLREGVTNVLRHSDADRCELAVEAVARSVRLRLVNDGVRGRAGAPGVGLENLTRRVRELGGTLTAGKDGDAFSLAVEVPLQPALIGRDADRVDAVPGVQLQDGRRQVVADGAPAQ